MSSNFAIYGIGFKNALARRMAYRGDFFITSFIILISELILPMVTYLIYKTGSSFPGWTMEEVLLIQAVFLISKGIAFTTFFGMVYNVIRHTRMGTYDLLLLKPKSILFITIVTSIDIQNIGQILGGIFLFGFLISRLPIPGLIQWIQFFILLLFSLSVFFSFALIFSGLLFRWIGNSRVWEIFDTVTFFGRYPLSIFSAGFQMFLTAVIPIAVIAFFPAAVLLNKPHSGLVVSGFVCLGFLCLSLLFWHNMLKQYKSAGG